MTTIGLVAEEWERAFAWASYEALCREGWRGRVLVPHFLMPPPERVGDARGLHAVMCGEGFVPRQAVLHHLREAAGSNDFEVIDAGVFRHAGGWTAPVHGAPRRPRHRVERIGAAEVWRVDTGSGYFDAIGSLAGYGPVWGQYGRAAPVFVFNTNDFDEPAPPPCRTYVVLGSGLLGLRLVLESAPPPDARLIIYDINPYQIDWTEFVLANAACHGTMESLIEAFKASHSEVVIRKVLPHEQRNADRQAAWYQAHAESLSALARLPRQTLVVDVMSDPEPLFRLLPDAGPTFFMYLDIFVVWQRQDDRLTILDLSDLAGAFEVAVAKRVSDRVTFIPGRSSSRLQL